MTAQHTRTYAVRLNEGGNVLVPGAAGFKINDHGRLTIYGPANDEGTALTLGLFDRDVWAYVLTGTTDQDTTE